MRNLLFAIFIALTLVACDSEEYKQGQVNSSSAVSVSNIILSPTGGEQTFTVTSNSNWNITQVVNNNNTEDRVVISPLEYGAAGTHQVTINVNNGSIVNNHVDVTLLFSNEDGTFASVPVRQNKPYLSVSSTNLLYDWFECSHRDAYEIDITSNTDWRFEDIAPSAWLSTSDTQYTHPGSPFERETKTITIFPNSYNLDAGDRKISLKLFAANDEKIIEINQSHKTLTYEYAGGEVIEFGPCNSEKNKQSITITSEFDSWEIDTEDSNGNQCDWIKDYSPKSGQNQTPVTIIPNANNSREDKSGYILLIGNEPGLESNPPTRMIPVKLQGYKLGFNGNTNDIADELSLPWDKAGTKQSVPFESSGAWSIEKASGDWFTITTSQGETSGEGAEYNEEGDLKVHITPDSKNLHIKNDRDGRVILKSKEQGVNLTQTLPVKQHHFNFTSNLPSNVEINTDDTNTCSFDLECSGDWEIIPEGSWLDVTPLSGSGNQKITYRATSNNTSTNDRYGKITIHSVTHKNRNDKSQLGYNEIVCDIKQLKFLFEVDPRAGSTFDFEALPNSTSYSISVNCSANWNVKSDASWVKVDNMNATSTLSYSGNKTLSITVDNNVEKDQRTGSITIGNTVNGTTYRFNIRQKAFEFDTGKISIYDIDAISPEVRTITLGNSMGNWVVNTPDWISASPSSGTGGNVDIKLTIQSYQTESQQPNREYTVTITSQLNSNLAKEIYISQKAHWLVVSDSAINIASKPTSNSIVRVECAGNWSVSTDANWIELPTKTGNGNGSFTIKASENTGKERTATIVVDSRGVKRTIEVTQAAK